MFTGAHTVPAGAANLSVEIAFPDATPRRRGTPMHESSNTRTSPAIPLLTGILLPIVVSMVLAVVLTATTSFLANLTFDLVGFR